MTKKHFEAIAKVINEATEASRNGQLDEPI